jgi:hypothetical protein
MAIDPSEVANSMSERYRALHDAFTDLAIDAAHYQNALQTHETAPRDMYAALTRIIAFCDHVHVALNMMGEEVHALDEAHGNAMGSDWNDQFEECFEDWLLSTPAATSKVQ